MDNKPPQKPENALLNILFNIVIPILILNRGSQYLGSFWALIIAISFPLGYGIYDLITRKKTNAISILGLLNVGITGSFALFKLQGLMFAIKEAAFPLLVGAFVFGSAFSKTPFISTLFLNPQLFNIDTLKRRLQERNTELDFNLLLKKATLWISLSFVFSAALNFFLAVRIFSPISTALEDEAQAQILNEQIARMTAWSMGVIVVPCMIFMILIFMYVKKGTQDLSGLSEDELLVQK